MSKCDWINQLKDGDHMCKDVLTELYLVRGYSAEDIGRIFKKAPSTIRYHLYKNNIRTRSEARNITDRARGKMSSTRKGVPTWNNGLKGRYHRWTKHGKDAPGYKGGVNENAGGGYRKIFTPDHPNADANGYVFEHRLVCEKYLGRYLTEDEIVHHRNRDRKDNRIENLFIFYSHKNHFEFHRQQKKFPALTEEEFCRGEDIYYGV